MHSLLTVSVILAYLIVEIVVIPDNAKNFCDVFKWLKISGRIELVTVAVPWKKQIGLQLLVCNVSKNVSVLVLKLSVWASDPKSKVSVSRKFRKVSVSVSSPT